ncbi:MAG: hypothetical protein E7171_05080 [Firmicutes bacterium]|nr:hypothetical protein [Bacillota bacterium]
MKKIILLIIGFTLIITGCTKQEDKYEGYKKYSLEGKEIRPIYFSNTHLSSSNSPSEYAMTDITEENSESAKEGLFYKTSNFEYILIDELETCEVPNNKMYMSNNYTYVYDSEGTNKLYIIRCLGQMKYEYNLTQEKVQKRELKFDTTSISNKEQEQVGFTSIEKVEKNYIYYTGQIYNTNQTNISIKCSLDTMKCELND